MAMMQAEHIIDCSGFKQDIVHLCSASATSPYEQQEMFLAESALLADDLPETIRRTLYDYLLHGNREGVLLLKHLPVDPGLDDTPTDGRPSAKTSYYSECCLAMFGARLGYLVGYAQEKDGAIFHDITPSKTQEQEQSSEGSRVPLEFHTERCFHQYLPSHVLLFCLRPDHARTAATYFASIRDIAPLLPAEEYDALFQPEFRTGIDYSFGNLETEKANGPVLSVLYGNNDDPFIRYDLDLMEALTSRAQRALDALQAVAHDVTKHICLDAGELLVMDNRRVVHGRSAFDPRYDGCDRWLQRVYVVSDITSSATDRKPGDRIINTDFSKLRVR